MTFRFTTLTRRAALAALLVQVGLTAAHAGPITGSGQPISDIQPSLGLNYIVRVADPGGTIADIGQVALFAGNFAPAGWALANGQQLPINSNQILFSRIGTTYGGNGTNVFALPNLNGRVAIGAGQGAGLGNQTLGAASGADTQILTADQLPPFGGATGVTTGSRPVTIRQPSLALNYGVVVQGIFPSRGGEGTASGPFIGQIVTYSGALPAGVLPADGRPVPINEFQPLFSLLGTNYGGNGISTFNLPDLQGRAPTEAGQALGLTGQGLGEKSGSEQVLLGTHQLPPNRVTLPNGKTAVEGGGQPFSIMQPSLGLHAIIDVAGAFPTRDATISGSLPFLGEITWFAGDFAPTGWDFADGQLLSIAQNQALFVILGNTFGGNGFSTFALPNLADRFAVGMGDGVSLGENFGSETDTLTYSQLPVGYPSRLPVTRQVPEPPGATIVMVGIAGLLMLRARSKQPGLGSAAV